MNVVGIATMGCLTNSNQNLCYRKSEISDDLHLGMKNNYYILKNYTNFTRTSQQLKTWELQ